LTEILQFSEVWGTIKPKLPSDPLLPEIPAILPQPPLTSVTCSAADFTVTHIIMRGHDKLSGEVSTMLYLLQGIQAVFLLLIKAISTNSK